MKWEVRTPQSATPLDIISNLKNYATNLNVLITLKVVPVTNVSKIKKIMFIIFCNYTQIGIGMMRITMS